MLDLKRRKAQDVRQYVCGLENVIIKSLQQFNVLGERREGRVGIWVEDKNGAEAKIAALGVRLRKWVTFHGVAINIAPDLTHYDGIVPCGISNYGVTSLQKLGKNIPMEQFDAVFKEAFLSVFK